MNVRNFERYKFIPKKILYYIKCTPRYRTNYIIIVSSKILYLFFTSEYLPIIIYFNDIVLIITYYKSIITKISIRVWDILKIVNFTLRPIKHFYISVVPRQSLPIIFFNHFTLHSRQINYISNCYCNKV